MGDPTITFNGNTVSFKARGQGLRIIPKVERERNQAASGKIEQINTYQRIDYRFDGFMGSSNHHDFMAFLSWAQQGNAFSFAYVSTQTGNTTLDGSATGGQDTIPVTSTPNFAAGDLCLIRSTDNFTFEVVLLSSKSTGTSVKATNNLMNSYTSGSAIRHLKYVPSAILEDETVSPEWNMVSSTSNDYFYRFSLSFTEDL